VEEIEIKFLLVLSYCCGATVVTSTLSLRNSEVSNFF